MTLPRPKAVYFFYNAALACLVPFMGLYYREQGMTAAEIGVLSGIIPLITWGSAPFWGGVADATRRHRGVLLLSIGGVWAAVLALYFAASFVGLLACVILYAVFVGPIVPLVDHAVLHLLGDNKAGYGRVRLWGSVGWGLAAVALAPAINSGGLDWAFYGCLAFLAVDFIVATGMPMDPGESARRAYSAGLGALARNGRFLLLLLTAVVYGITLGVLLSYQFLYLEDLGAGRMLMSISLTVTTISEIPFWFISAGLLRRLGTSRMIVLALGASTLRYLALGAMTTPWLVLPISLLHGPSFAMLWSAGVTDAHAAAPPGLGATAQGLFAGMVFGLGAALGGFLGGPAYAAIGFAQLFSFLGWLSLAMLVVFVVARRLPRHVFARG